MTTKRDSKVPCSAEGCGHPSRDHETVWEGPVCVGCLRRARDALREGVEVPQRVLILSAHRYLPPLEDGSEVSEADPTLQDRF